jgi:hypothetical protein
MGPLITIKTKTSSHIERQIHPLAAAAKRKREIVLETNPQMN